MSSEEKKDAPQAAAPAEGEAQAEGKGAKGKGGKGRKKERAAAQTGAAEAPRVPPRVRERYRAEVRPALMKQFGIQNPMAVPGLKKIVINMGCKGAVETKARIDAAVRDLAVISGQKPTVRKARTSIASFKLRQGMPIGVAVTLRGTRMWEFADRLISVVLPRIRDFRGLKTKLDGRGNYTLGLSEQSVFPEVDFDKIEYVQGMDVTFVTSAPSDEQGFFLLKQLGIPFKTDEKD
ncbi:MAG: 50S ribosomal protein L5 [Planctomycetes bacterium]|nr:50S ribosomal protein L5 [Planctomycetota bacterium]